MGSGHLSISAEGEECLLSPEPQNEAAVNLGQARAMAARDSEAPCSQRLPMLHMCMSEGTIPVSFPVVHIKQIKEI